MADKKPDEISTPQHFVFDRTGEIFATGKELDRRPLLVLHSVEEAGFFGRLLDKVRLMFE